jgi:predicted DNA-binding transcriptional regulator YafY
MNIKRFTLCFFNHKWVSVAYSEHEDSGRFLRCQRCGHENHKDYSTVATGAPIGF